MRPPAVGAFILPSSFPHLKRFQALLTTVEN
jgi:hypothetical protein